MTRAVDALEQEIAAVAGGAAPMSHMEFAEIALALNTIIRNQEAQAEQITRFYERAAEQDKKIEETREVMLALYKRAAKLAEEVSPAEREAAQARMATAVSQQTQHIRATAEADRLSMQQQLGWEPTEEVNWPHEPYVENVGRVQFHIVTGPNRVPVSVAAEVRNRIRGRQELRDREAILKVGKRPGHSEEVLSAGEVDQWMARIDRKYGVRTPNPADMLVLNE